MQWRNEIEKYTEGFKVAIWHGASRETDQKALQKNDVVLTTYAVLESSFRKQQSGFKRQGQIVKQKSPLHEIKWHRIIVGFKICILQTSLLTVFFYKYVVG